MIYRNLFNESHVEEQEKLLKYFYLIDSDQIVSELKALSLPGDSANLQNVQQIFHTVFEKIYISSTLYNKYTDPDGIPSAAFFGEPDSTKSSSEERRISRKKFQSLAIFLKLSLRNYCITQGFFYSLTEKNAHNSMPLSAPYEQALNSGYFAAPICEKNSLPAGSNKYQFYNSHYKAIRTLGEDSFLWQVLDDSSLGMNSDILSTQSPFKFQVPLVYKYWIYFVFLSPAIHTISRNVKKNAPHIAKHYQRLYKEFIEKEAELTLPIDKFIFHTMGDYYLGFSSMSYINQLMGKIYDKSMEKDSHLQKYRGQIFETILSQLSCCPMPYTRHFFMHYALEALRNNLHVGCEYLTHTPNIAVGRSNINASITEEEAYAKGLGLLPKYFSTLNNITLPILSCLWRSVIGKLFGNDDFLLDCYKTYIEAHYKLLTADFTMLSFKEIENCCLRKRPNEPTDDPIYPSFSLKTLAEKLSSRETDVSLEDIFLTNRFSDILCNFLKMNNKTLNPIHIPFLYQKLPTDNDHKLKYETFSFNRAKNIFELFS